MIDTPASSLSLHIYLLLSFVICRYTPSSDLKGEAFFSEEQVYEGGGYVANLGNSQVEASKLIAALQATHWIDQYTRAVFVEVNVFNANTQLFSMVTVLLEMLSLGGVMPSLCIESIVLYRYTGNTLIIFVNL